MFEAFSQVKGCFALILEHEMEDSQSTPGFAYLRVDFNDLAEVRFGFDAIETDRMQRSSLHQRLNETGVDLKCRIQLL